MPTDFETTVEWNGGYPAKLSCQNGLSTDYSYPVEFGGLKGYITPEDAFVSAANMCYQIIFSGIAKSLGIDLAGYRCRAVGKLDTIDGIRKFVSIDLHPEIRLRKPVEPERLQKALDATKRKCLVTNSMDLEIRVFPMTVEGA